MMMRGGARSVGDVGREDRRGDGVSAAGNRGAFTASCVDAAPVLEQLEPLSLGGCLNEPWTQYSTCRCCRVSAVGLHVVLPPKVRYADLCRSIRVAVCGDGVCFHCEMGVNLVVTALEWPERYREEESVWRIFVSMKASCVQTSVEGALCREMRLLQGDMGLEQPVVDTTGFGMPGRAPRRGALYLWYVSWCKSMAVDNEDIGVAVRLCGDADRHWEENYPLNLDEGEYVDDDEEASMLWHSSHVVWN